MTFACTYAGQPVCLDHDGRLADLLETRWPDPGWLFSRERMGGSASPFLAGGINDRIKPPYPELPRIRLNEVIVPTGASRFARGLFVVDNVRLKEIVYDAYGHTDASPPALSTLPADWDDAWIPQTLAITQGGVTFSRSMYLLPPVVLDASGDNTLWLLPLVDARYFWQTKGFEDADNASGWSALITSLVGEAGTTLSGSVSPNAAYGTFDPETFTDKSISVGAALDAAALSIGHRAVYSGGAAVAFQTAADADSLRATNLALDGLRLGGTSPGTIKAESPRVTCRLVNDHWPAPTGFYDVVPSVNNTGTSPDRPSIRSSWYVEHFGGTIDSAASTAVQSFADQLATDLLAWGNRPYVASFAGIANWTLSGHDDYLAIRIHDDIGGAAAIMRVASLPMSFRPAVNLCQRPDIYVHPHSTATGTLYEMLAPGESAELVFDAAASLYEGTPANVDVTLSASNSSSGQSSGTKVFLHYQAGQGWAVVATASSSEPTWIDFQLTADMTGSGQTTATVQAIRGDAVVDTVGGEVETVAVGSTVTVYDDNGLWGDLVAGCTGKALYRPHPSNPAVAQFGIHSSTRPINKIVARVSGEMLATSESVTVDTLNRILSQEPHISAPNELLAEPIAVKAANDWHLHAQYGSDVEIERVREGIIIGEGESAETVYWRVTRVSLPFPYRILGKLTEDFGAVTSTYTPVEVIKSFGATYDQISVNGHLVDTFGDYFISSHSNFFWKKGDRAVLEYDAQENKYFITRVMGRAEWIKGTVYADFTATDATFEISNLAGIDGPLEELVTQITVSNLHGWDGTTGQKVLVQRNLATGVYEARQKDC